SKGFALLVIALDGFQEITSAFGHHYGDLLLQEIGPCVRAALRESDILARLGGEQFAVLVPACDQTSDALTAAGRILKCLEKPFALEGRVVTVEASAGIALYPEHGAGAETLLRHADVAMYAAKRDRSRYALYAAEQDADTAGRLMLTAELRQAIERAEFVLHYQPKVDFKTGRLTAVESLVRWQHPQRGLMPPDSFIPLAEQTGLIQPLTEWVMAEGLRQCRAWHDAGLLIAVAINQSMGNLYDPGLPAHIAELLDRHGVQPAHLTIEITESMIMAHPRRAMEIISRLSEMGISLSIDDFGTGYSSLGYLKRLPAKEIKVDKSFVADMLMDENDATIVRSTIDLAHNLGLKVVAEGVETREMWNALAELGCDGAQGYYVAKPMPAAELEQWAQDSPFGWTGDRVTDIPG
ncbi:MAG: bifunctional diguanylate cyclase/phosphodiesterase, partial [Chloroflexota bacterium]|nr:bifunctional diguanylate cyclase/phosphodiesterase [Chloroflexota bacterium]